MLLAPTDRRAIHREAVTTLRSSFLPLGDVLTLDALIEPLLATLDDPSTAPNDDPVELLDGRALPLFSTALERAVSKVLARDAVDGRKTLMANVAALRARTWHVKTLPESLEPVDLAIETWIDRIGRNDRATAMHSRAVGAWAMRIALHLKIEPAEAVHIGRCGTIHDVGKIGTPLEILTAPRRLTPREWKEMERHVVDGWTMVNDDPLLSTFGAVVRHHHERFDGAGYPDGLAENAIDLPTRIVTVADAFNAMIAERPYRVSLPPAVALEELERHSGTQFDPACVDAMRAVVTGAEVAA